MGNNIRAKKYRRKYYRNADYTKKYELLIVITIL
jgi:hypothetical protein